MDIAILVIVVLLAVGLVGCAAFLKRREKNDPLRLPFDGTTYAEMIAEGYISVRSHPDDDDLLILNYTPKAQYEKVWNDVTEQCRGLIVKNGRIVARPFRKFYNLGELEFIPDGPILFAQAKMDGSLGIIYKAPDGLPAVATRGSFVSEQAQWATIYLRGRGDLMLFAQDCISKSQTPLVEIVYPENRIVVDYKGESFLALLTVIDNATGKDVESIRGDLWSDPIAKVLHAVTIEDLERINKETKGEDGEGFVIMWADGTRAKVKSEDYLDLHYMLTGVTPRKIHAMLMNRQGIEPLRDKVPDEFFAWMESQVSKLNSEFTEIEQKAIAVLAKVDRDADRKTQAEFITKQENAGLVFKMLDGKPYEEIIWKMVRPGAEPFRTDIDG